MKSDSNLIIAVIVSGVLFFTLGMHYERNNPSERKGNSYQKKEGNYTPGEKGISFQGENENDIIIREIVRTIDSLDKIAAELPVSCNFEYIEDINFKKHVRISISNNTKEEINSVRLNSLYSSAKNVFGIHTNFESTERITIPPGKSKTIYQGVDLTGNYILKRVEVVKYWSNGKVEYNGGIDGLLREYQRTVGTYK
jgi:hypothetical protein